MQIFKKFFLLIFSIIILPISMGCIPACIAPSEMGENDDENSQEISNQENTYKENKNDNMLVNKVEFYDIPEGVEEYSNVQVFIGEEQLPLYSVQVNTSQSWTPTDYKRTANGVGLFSLEGSATVVVKPDVQINYSSRIRPLSSDIIPIADIQNNTLTFEISGAGEYVLEINGDKYNAVHLFVSDFSSDVQTAGYTKIVKFEAGLHTAQNDDRINSSDNSVRLTSNTLVILDDGAVVRAKFYADSADNIAIVGRGIIDGSTFERDASTNNYKVTVPIDFNYCTNVKLKNFFVLDPAGWCVNFYFITGGEIDDIKIISSRSNGDGISLQSCKDISVDGCFVRTWDDSLVVKNYPQWTNRSNGGTTKNITFKNCTIWTDLAQSMELGYETVGKNFSDVTFENITVLHALHNAVISIHNANNADIKNITYKNITIEDAYSTTGTIIDIRVLFSETWSTNHATTSLGSVDGVNIQNVKVISAKQMCIDIGGWRDTRKGYESDHYVNNVAINGLSLAGKILSKEDCKINNYGYLNNFTISQSEQVTGAESPITQNNLSGYGNELEVNFIKNK